MNRKMLVGIVMCISSVMCASQTLIEDGNECFPVSCASVDLQNNIAVIRCVQDSKGIPQVSHHTIITGTHWGLCFETIKGLCSSGSEAQVRIILDYMHKALWSRYPSYWKKAASLNDRECDFTSDAIIAAAYKGSSFVAKKSG